MPSPSHLINSVANTTAHRDRDDLDHAVVSLLLQFLQAASASIYHLRDDGGTVRVIPRTTLSGQDAQSEPASSVDPGSAPALADVEPWQQCVTLNKHVEYGAKGRARTVFPIEAERVVVGLLEIETAARLQPRDASLVAGILRIMKNHLALLDYGERDTLTGLLNRKTFEASFEKLRNRIRNASAQQEPSWLGVVDIDKFKSINDTYGHLFGDEVLLLVAQIMKKSFRGGDLLFRFGGEEFVIVLERASAEGAQIAFDRLRAEIEAFSFPQVGRVTISLGYTRIEGNDGPGTSVERADEALYYAKHNGRNRVCNYEALIATGDLKAKTSGDDIELF